MNASDSNSIKPTPNSNADAPNVDGPDAPESRGGYMSFGDHLEELRSCSILAVAGVFVATTVSMIFAKRILGFILNPLVVIQNAHGLEAQAQAINPPDTFILYLKMAFLAGIVLSMPWTLIQIWRFVALGLFSHERKFLKLITPASIGLFATGAVFMFYIVLPIVLNFFIEFGEAITIDNLEPSWITGVIVGDNDADEPPAPTDTKLDQIAMLAKDPIDPPVGSEWFNTTRHQRCLMTKDGIYTTPMHPSQNVSVVKSQFGLSQYVSFVLMLTLAFGLAFELPLVIIFITSMGLISVDDLKKYRRYIIFVTFIVAAILTPPDVISQLLLAIPMMILFEGALIVSKFINKPKPVNS
ncbi:MAG: twin-arginine translocase subunit TatC [Phycisphaerae bacterium]|nr:twin-arginine translocase subunit TatC [Phycisphaerales bacterium]